ncbi:MAG: hypothetical protein ACXAE3_12165 [Candidatus Kariarchaeaceae archaeon]|jgi:hypothetical protein
MGFFDDLLVGGHPAVIHFPIIGIMMGMVAAVTALVLGVLLDIFDKSEWLTEARRKATDRFIDRFEFASWIMIFMGELGLLIASYTGFQSAGGVDPAVENELLAFKVKLSIFVFFILIGPILLKAYLGLIKNRAIFGYGRIIPVLYILPQLAAAILTVLISGTGGRYVYGHSILDNIGLGWLLPG